ncbi:MAG: hypothetical protein J4F39_17215 [Candidatus Latescibacteria bacterium]|nr:hypothetical protein [Candidatus Latescibacterota bacterium]
MKPERVHVTYGPREAPRFEVEMITDTAGRLQTGGSGASCWGYNQSNIVRSGEDVYALSWRDDMTLVVFRRVGDGRWEPSDPLPPVPQNGNLLVDRAGRLHVIAGENGSYHAIFDPPGQVDRFTIQEYAAADSRFGASIDAADRIFVAGGLPTMAWYVLDPETGYRPVASGSVKHEQNRGYNFVILNGSEAHTISSDDYFLAGEQFPNQTVKLRDRETGKIRMVETPRGIYPVLKAYYYTCPDVFEAPEDWRMTVISDVSDTFDGCARGTTDHQDLMMDTQGRVHLTYYENRQPATTVWAGRGQDPGNSLLYHAVGEPGGPFEHYCLGNFNGGGRPLPLLPDPRGAEQRGGRLVRGGRRRTPGPDQRTGSAGNAIPAMALFYQYDACRRNPCALCGLLLDGAFRAEQQRSVLRTIDTVNGG